MLQGLQGVPGRVSIPNRDFDELQYGKIAYYSQPQTVSIPNRDFDELQLVLVPCVAVDAGFQSLIGILMNCNAGLGI